MPLTHIQLRPKEVSKKSALAEKLKKPFVIGPIDTHRKYGPPSREGPSEAELLYEKKTRGVAPRGVTRTPLERALTGGPATGQAKDIQAEAWARREEIVAEEQAKLDAEADALYGAAQDLSLKDQDFILSKIVGKAKPSALGAALGAEPGAISPAAIRTDPLMQTMIDKHYIRLDENGQTYSWMLPEPEKKFVEMIQDPQSGELKKVYADGSIESTGMFGSLEPEVEAPTVSEQISLARLQFDIEKYGQSNVAEATKQLGDAPIEGVTTLRKKGTDNYRTATAADVEAYYVALEDLSQYLKVQKSGPQTMEDMEALYRNRPEEIKVVQQQYGMIPDGVWSDELAQKLYATFTREE